MILCQNCSVRKARCREMGGLMKKIDKVKECSRCNKFGYVELRCYLCGGTGFVKNQKGKNGRRSTD